MTDQEEAEQRPRKIFELKFEIWDDCEITNSIIEIVQQERGAPKKWHMEATDFIASMRAKVSTTPEAYGDIILELLGLKNLSYTKKESDAESEDDSEGFDFDEDAA